MIWVFLAVNSWSFSLLKSFSWVFSWVRVGLANKLVKVSPWSKTGKLLRLFIPKRVWRLLIKLLASVNCWFKWLTWFCELFRSCCKLFLSVFKALFFLHSVSHSFFQSFLVFSKSLIVSWLSFFSLSVEALRSYLFLYSRLIVVLRG